jgi:signal transduction histidine kinase/ActR/RegA family two-component response regulator
MDPSGELRVLLRAATAKDCELMISTLRRAGIESASCLDCNDILREIGHGAGVLVMAEELLQDPAFAKVLAALQAQPDWSDLPVIVLARTGADSPAIARIMEALGSLTVLERPMRVAAFVSAVRAALAGRKRQYVLRATLEGLREADQRKTEFLATLAHELRNPLAPMRTALSVLMNKQPDAQTSRKFFEMMDRQVQHMVRLIDDLLEVSRITRGKIALQIQPVDLIEVLRDAADVSRPLAEAAGQQLVLRLPAGRIDVAADKVRLVQVFANLMNNASRYSPAGTQIEIAVARNGADAEVVVRDQGIGIPSDMLGEVFELFVQVGDAARAAQGGLGIGLTLVRKLVELHGGSVDAQSAGSGKGSVFTVRLPTCDREEAVVPAAHATLDLLGQKVLIVDDNGDAADSLALLVAMFGATVKVAYGGADALRLVEELRPDIGILDLGMPGMDGYELARTLRGSPETAGMFLVALTGWGQDSDRVKVSAAGFDRHLLKPVDIQDLAAALAQAHPASEETKRT